mgnify:CR=1 FL=1
MNESPIVDWATLTDLPKEGTVCWTSRSLVAFVSARLPFEVVASIETPRSGLARLVVVGGGSLIDRAKVWRRELSPDTWMVVVPSLWGSGAENSPIAVLNEGDVKVIKMGPDFLPDARAYSRELTELIPPEAALWGAGDAWSHALEGFLSPLSNDALREEMASFIRDVLLPLEPGTGDFAWFEASAKACSLQSRSGVGLIHAIAHQIEPTLKRDAKESVGHARLCSTLLLPVFDYNRSRGSKVDDLFRKHGIPLGDCRAMLRRFFDEADYRRWMPTIESSWSLILRQPLARINCALVRADSLDFFRTFLPEEGET